MCDVYDDWWSEMFLLMVNEDVLNLSVCLYWSEYEV